MTLRTYEEIRDERIMEVARAMAVAARTAPKGRGTDHLVCTLVDGEELTILADKMAEIGEREEQPFFRRDADNLRRCRVVVVLGTTIEPMGLKLCGMCGFSNCDEKRRHPAVPCVFNTGDLGIAIGSAVSLAGDLRVDNRVMYTIGQAVRELGWLGEETRVIYGIPLSATSKSPFFDRG